MVEIVERVVAVEWRCRHDFSPASRLTRLAGAGQQSLPHPLPSLNPLYDNAADHRTHHARPRRVPAGRRRLSRNRPARRVAHLVETRRAQPLPRVDPQCDAGSGRVRPARQPAHQRGPPADRTGPPPFRRRHDAGRRALRRGSCADRGEPVGRRPDRKRARAGHVGAVGTVGVRGPGPRPQARARAQTARLRPAVGEPVACRARRGRRDGRESRHRHSGGSQSPRRWSKRAIISRRCSAD